MHQRWSVARTIRFLLTLALALSIWAPRDAQASWVESLVMPGEVVAKHAEVEQKCDKCHEPFDKAAQDRLCLACHKDVAADRDGKHGYHGQEPSVQGRPCKTCHAEHQGRSAQLVRLDRKTFQHRFTDMPLRGGHTRVPCENCHAPGKRYREAIPHCSNCHARKDPHEGSVGTACDNCHTEAAWKTVHFDHDTAAFRLEGRHREAHCEGCHKTKRFKPTASTCFACHEQHDKHHGSFGNECQSCHTPTRKWTATTFDHAHKTHFPLVGRHASATCEKCHKDGLAAARTPTNCYGCHERDDHHHGQFGRTCETCHTPTEWKRYTFEHDRSTHFPLRGRHKELHCADCHRGILHEERLDKSCYTCHREDDVHHGRQGLRCEKCHDERGWSREVLVDHNTTRVPLTGAHARVACLRCHLSPVFKDVARECVSCHQREGVQRCQRGTECERCHETSTFRVTRAPQ
jgi:hypothetical protein